MIPKRIAILGPGLLGGSLLLGCAARRADCHLSVWARREEALEEVRRSGVCEVASRDLAAVVCGADLVVLCTPIGAMPELATRLVPEISENCLVTDVGSVKLPVVKMLGEKFGDRFVGAHPMAGSEVAGFLAARKDLYENALCIMTPQGGQEERFVARCEAFWAALGARTARLDPLEHDEIISRVSHLPHLVASCMVLAAVRDCIGDLEFSGPGFRDSTRIARGPVSMWTEILMTNREPLLQDIDCLRETLLLAREALASGRAEGINDILQRARAALINHAGKNLENG